ncbi:MAG: alpha/beta hydrolase-fold protein [Gammaproteobacteria bacterium]|nr:alpha/beta hydrolase-fold protein [Gammaproteobacteria bacterium]MCZ6579011.1 alpha/beta hydrolase-fold protein [Gammaproteobacteria bacterium]MCZ6667818.1 alpha/beta hydrolase-fold protein [Gammaproteobacteria bacterium]MCZ6722735.1 alpha/beta hydrolase-fold protein [Gammaproteobacteria bacterium]MCZ6798121.1 alpha/beta hydrolase-fold protein [Gammaproteobacteria bacterium]
MSDSPIVIEIGSGPPDSCVIWLHGLGADGHDFEPIVPELKLNADLNIRFVFPHAPMIPVTINQGFVMRAWYDIRETKIDAEPDKAGIRQSSQALVQMIEEQVESGIVSERIVLAGFSQGGAIALFTALRYPGHLAGVMVLSAYMPLPQSLAAEKSDANSGIPIFLAHGSDDTVVPIELAYVTRGKLEKEGYPATWMEYQGMMHSVSEKEIFDISEWLEGTLL